MMKKPSVNNISSKLLLITFLFSPLLFGQNNSNDFDSLLTKGMRQIYDIKFEEADTTVSLIKEKFPNHPAGYFFDAMIYWWKIMLDFDNEEYDDILIDKLEDVIDLCDDILDDDPENADAVFFKGGALGFRGRLGAVREDWFSAGMDGKEALPLVYRAYELDSLNNDVQLGFGIYNYYASVIPEQYPMVKPIMFFFPSGDKDKGIAQLEKAAYDGKYSKYESRYFLMTLFYKFEKNYSAALKYAKLLTNEFPDNPSFQRYLGRIVVGMGDYSSASEIFRAIRNKCLNHQRGYSLWSKREADYYLAMNFKNNSMADSAITYFNECVKISEAIDDDTESGFLINAVFYLGTLYEQMGLKDEAIKNFNRVLDMREFQNSHDKAERHLEALIKN
jgi:tetratricopeptide (TPR) repeat protein